MTTRPFLSGITIPSSSLLLAGLLSCTATSVETGDAGAAADSQADTAAVRRDCPVDLPGPSMVLVNSPQGVNYCIDSTEVTQGQYFEFLRGVGSTVKYAAVHDDVKAQIAVPAGCEHNGTLGPSFASYEPCTYYPHAYDRDEKHLDYPVACVNWCAAYAYCAWAGKRLCGRIGGGGLTEEQLADPNTSQWFNACSQGGTTKYAYGDEFEQGTCSEGSLGADSPVNAEALVAQPEAPTDCHGTVPPFDQITNLSGNVAEWQDACRMSGKYWGCFAQATALTDPESQAQRDACAASVPLGMTQNHHWVGIRCCLD